MRSIAALEMELPAIFVTLQAKEKRIENPFCQNCVKKFHFLNDLSRHGELHKIVQLL